MGSEEGTVDRGPVTRDLQFALWTLPGLSVSPPGITDSCLSEVFFCKCSSTLIKKKTKFASDISKSRMEQLQSHI
jgi:hypothetical protein